MLRLHESAKVRRWIPPPEGGEHRREEEHVSDALRLDGQNPPRRRRQARVQRAGRIRSSVETAARHGTALHLPADRTLVNPSLSSKPSQLSSDETRDRRLLLWRPTEDVSSLGALIAHLPMGKNSRLLAGVGMLGGGLKCVQKHGPALVARRLEGHPSPD